MVLQKFDWTKFFAVAIPAKVNGRAVVAIVNTGSAGVVILESRFERLGLAGDDEVEYTIISATDSNKKFRKFLFGVKIAVGKSKKSIPALVLEGLHFDVLLGMSWNKKATAIVNAAEGVVSLYGDKLKFKPFPELALFIVKEVVRVYSFEIIVLPLRKSLVFLVRNQAVTGNEVYFFNYRDKLNI